MQAISPIRRLLRRNISASQMAGYLASNLAGLFIVLVALQFYCDLHTVFARQPDRVRGENYVIISRRVGGIGALTALPGLSDTANAFTPARLSEIASQPWALKCAPFTPARFDVFARASLGAASLSTSLFLEAVPDEFLDVTPPAWTAYDPDSSPFLPIILPKDYLTLYNFGYASAHGLPRLSESMIGMLPLTLSLSGNGLQQQVPARVVAFSSRINTIAVPAAFLARANDRLGYAPLQPPSRIIVKVTSRADKELAAYLDANGLELAGERADMGHLADILRIITAVVIAVGVIITALSCLILILSIRLLLQKNRRRLHDLMLLGCPPRRIIRSFALPVTLLTLLTLAVALGLTFAARAWWLSRLAAMGLQGGSLLPMLIAAPAIQLTLTILNLTTIRSRVISAFRH